MSDNQFCIGDKVRIIQSNKIRTIREVFGVGVFSNYAMVENSDTPLRYWQHEIERAEDEAAK